MNNWRKVSHQEFHESFDARKATLVSSYTKCSEDYAESVFSMTGDEPKHKTVHNNGLLAMPDFFLGSFIAGDDDE